MPAESHPMPWAQFDNRALALVLLLSLLAFRGVVGLDFVNYDDNEYLTENPIVQSGLSLDGLLWALTTDAVANWHPVTWLSLMLDASVFGTWAPGFHASNLLWHLLATALCYISLRRLTGDAPRSAIIALFHGIHPMHVESVAWVSQRKDLVSTCFAFAAILLWFEARRRSSKALHGFALLSFFLGLAAKPMLVTLPFVLLLFERWPLRAISGSTPRDVIISLAQRAWEKRA